MAKLDIVDGKLVRREADKPKEQAPIPVPRPQVEQRQPEQFQRPPQMPEQYQKPVQQEQYPQEELPQFSEEELRAAYEKKLMEEYAAREAEERRMMMEKNRAIMQQQAQHSDIISFHLVLQGDRQIDFGVARQDANNYNQTIQRAMEKGDIIQIGNRVISARHISTYWFD